jgi:hypothetical protein
METPASLLVGKPLHILAVALVFIVAHGLLRATRAGSTAHPRAPLEAAYPPSRSAVDTRRPVPAPPATSGPGEPCIALVVTPENPPSNAFTRFSHAWRAACE